MFLPPGVSEAFAERSGWGFGYVTWDEVRALVKPRAEDAHKGMYGHALLVCGSRGMPGAAVLSAGAALRSGCGLVTVHLPESERFPVEANFPSAMVSLDTADCFTELPADMTRYTAVGIGCGLGQDSRTVEALECLLEWCRTRKVRMVIDADALNMLSRHTGLQRLVPAGTILTPHLGELRRLVGTWRDEEEMLERANGLAARLDSVVVVKGPNPLFIFLYHLISQTIYKYESKDSFTHLIMKFILSPNPNIPHNAADEYCTTVLSHLLAKS